ncbi:MAG: hypothetical protein AAGA30_02765, partial [Planctomycetota bacterium]
RHVDDTAAPGHFVALVGLHVATACLIVIGTTVQLLRSRNSEWIGSGIRTSISILGILVLTQFSLGLGTWVVKFGWPGFLDHFQWAASFVVPEKSFFQINTITAHAALGSLILAFFTIHASRSCRVSYLSTFEVEHRAESGGIGSDMSEIEFIPNQSKVLGVGTKKGGPIAHPIDA